MTAFNKNTCAKIKNKWTSVCVLMGLLIVVPIVNYSSYSSFSKKHKKHYQDEGIRASPALRYRPFHSSAPPPSPPRPLFFFFPPAVNHMKLLLRLLTLIVLMPKLIFDLGVFLFFFITGSRLDIWRRCAGTVLDERSGNNKLSPDAGRVNYLWLTKGKQFCWIMTFVESDQRSCETNARKKKKKVKCKMSRKSLGDASKSPAPYSAGH